MKKFSEFVSEEVVDEGILSGVLGMVAGIVGTFTTLLTFPWGTPLALAVFTGGFIEFITSIDRSGGDGDVTSIVKGYLKKYNNKKFMENMTEEKAQKIISDMNKKKSNLKGAYKGAVTKLENELSRAFEKGDEAEIGRILKNFIKRLEEDKI